MADFSVYFWGVRGSLPACGPDVERSGGHTSMVEMRCGDHVLIFDAGTAAKIAGDSLYERGISQVDVFFSHFHYDHIIGLPFLLFALGKKVRIDLWGGHRAAWEAALGQARAAEVDSQAASLTLAADVARGYSSLGHAFIVLDLAKDDLERTGKMLDLSKRRLQAGIDSHYQYQQTESLEASSREQLINAQKQLNSARIALAVLLGKGPDRGVDIARPKILAPGAVALPSTLPAELLGRRPDLVAARWRVEAASKNIAAAKTRFYPNLNLSAAAGTQSLLGDALFGSASRFLNIAPAVSLPIFDGGRLRAGLDAEDANYDLAVAQYNKTLVGALGDVSDTLAQLGAVGQQISAQQQATRIAQDSFDTVLQRYGSGVGNYLDVLSIEQQLLQAQRQLADLNAEQIDLSIQLMQALGGGFEPGTTAETAPTEVLAGRII